MKKYIAVILTALLLCSCAKDNAVVTESVTTPIEKTVITEESAPAHMETPVTTAVSKVPVITYWHYSENASVQSYMLLLGALEQFNELKASVSECLICDINSDGTPEVVLQTGDTTPFSAIFSVDGNGAFMAEPAGGTVFTDTDTKYSYDGSIPQSFIQLGQDQYFAECRTDDSDTGKGGVIKLNLNGRQLSSEYVGEYSYGEHGCIYKGFENEEQYNDYIRTYFRNLETQWKKMPKEHFSNGGVTKYMPEIIKLLEDYYEDRDELLKLEEQLDDSVKFNVEFKPVYEHRMDNMSLALPQVFDYDYAGNVIFDNHYGDYLYTYYPDGKIKSQNAPHEGLTEYDEDGNITASSDELVYDESGRLICKKEERDVTEYFYNSDTDELVKKIYVYNTDSTETTYYENGLEIRIEWHKPSWDNFYTKIITLKEYTSDGYTAKSEYFDKDGNTVFFLNSVYNNKHGLIKQEKIITEYYPAETALNASYTFAENYDKDGKHLSSIYVTGKDNENVKIYEYIYDKYGNLTKEILTYDSEDETAVISQGIVSVTYTYEFDLAGNIVESIKNSGDCTEITQYRPVRVICS